MKKLLALLLCLSMMLCLAACGQPEGEETTDTVTQSVSENVSEEEHDHNHIGYKGQEKIFTPEDMVSIEGRECDFTYEQNDSTLYIYNDVTVGEMSFTQVQFTFNEDHNRISCTYTVDAGTEEAPRSEEEIASDMAAAMSGYEQSLTALYGEGARSEQHGYELVSWRDHTGNYIILTQINDKTAQVAYYIYGA